MALPASPQLLYICSAGHSGSTLLDLLLGAHTGVESLGEIIQLPKNLSLDTECCCGEKVSECTFWSEVITRLDKRLNISIANDPYSLDLGFIKAVTVVDRKHQTPWQIFRRKLAFASNFYALMNGVDLPGFMQEPLQRGVRNKWALYEEVATVSGKNVVVDSTKHYLEAVNLYRARPENTKIILLTRDGRAVFQSGLKHGMSHQDSLDAWLNTYNRALPLIERYVPEENVFRVRYEDLAQDPEKTMRALCEFAGLDYQDAMVDLGASVNHITNGNNMRFQKGASIRYDNAWIDKIKAEDLAYFEKAAKATNTALGYPEDIADYRV